MSEVKWIKISTGIFDDEKIKLIESMPDSDTILVIWIKLLALAGRQNDHGQVYLSELTPYNDKMLAHIFNRKESTVKLAMKTFSEFGMIEIMPNQSILISNWDKHQNIDGLEKIRESGRERVRRFREKSKIPQLKDREEKKENRIEGNVTCNVTVTLHPLQERIWKLFNRRPSTRWSDVELRAWRNAQDIVEETTEKEWELLEWTYRQVDCDAARYRKTAPSILLNNWHTQIGRSHEWFKAAKEAAKPVGNQL